MSKRTIDDIESYLERRLKFWELGATTARTPTFHDRCNAVAISYRSTLEYLRGGAEVLTNELNEEEWKKTVKRG